MNRKWLIAVLTLALCASLLGCQTGGVQSTDAPPAAAPTSGANLPNPAAVHCQELGYTYEIRTAADGSQSGVCIQPDGSECDEWALYRGECGPSPTGAPTSGAQLPNPASVYCEEQGGKLEIRTAADGSQSGACMFKDGSECDEWAFFRGECAPGQAATVPAGSRVWLDRTSYAPGEEIQVHFVVPSAPLSGAWLGIIPSDIPHGDESTNDEHDLDYQYLAGQMEGVLTFNAPSQPGSYDFRLHDTDDNGQEIASVTFVVSGGADKPELWLDKTSFAPGEEIQVHFVVPDIPVLPRAWVGIVPSDIPHGDESTNDENDVDYQYLEGQVVGTLTFLAPSQPGSYDFRLNDTDDDGQEIASVTFAVSGGADKAELWLDKTAFAPSEEIQVHFVVPDIPVLPRAWVGIVPSDIPHGDESTNDENDVDYRYLDGQVVGILTFLAPSRPGSYDFRLNDTDDDGQEIASVTFTVSGGVEKPELWLDKTTFAPGEEIQVHFATPPTYPDDAWIGLIPSEVAHGSAATNDEYDLDYDYLNGRVAGVFTFVAPGELGSYDFRLHDSNSGLEVASVTFEVK